MTFSVRFIVLFSLTLLILGQSCSAYHKHPIVQALQGIFRGNYKLSRNGIQYESFLGVKYGEVLQRFDESVPTGSWYEFKDATEFGSSCAQESTFSFPVIGVEDCLFLNVFTPKADNKKRGVLVFIHGGGFFLGSPLEYGGGYLVDEDTVLVTLNYRLGILGFLNTRDGVSSGNMGLKDQLLALKWVHNNIEFFGGDPNGVTVAGQSAGGASALFLLLSPNSKGLFNGVLSMSGTPLDAWAYTQNTGPEVKEIYERLKCRTSKRLRTEPLNTLLPAQRRKSFNPRLDFLDPQPMTPSLEVKSAGNRNPLLNRNPLHILRRGDFPKVPVLLTLVRNDGFYGAAVIARNEEILRAIAENFDELAPVTFAYGRDSRFQNCRNSRKFSEKIFKFYFKNQELTRASEPSLTKLYTDGWFTPGITKTAQLLSAHTQVYAGLLSRPISDFSSANVFGVFGGTEKYVTHSDDLVYIFEPTGQRLDNVTTVPVLTNPKDIEFSKKMVQIVAGFVKTGVPSVPFKNAPKWNPLSKTEGIANKVNWFTLEEFPRVTDRFQQRVRFWEELYKHCGGKRRNHSF